MCVLQRRPGCVNHERAQNEENDKRMQPPRVAAKLLSEAAATERHDGLRHLVRALLRRAGASVVIRRYLQSSRYARKRVNGAVGERSTVTHGRNACGFDRPYA